MNRHERRKLDKVYAKIPNANCKGLCVDSCTVIGMEYIEYVQLTKVSGVKPFFQDGHCGYLVDGRCSVYNARPAVCRLSGTTHGMPCPFGCVPDRMVPKSEGKAIMREVRMMGGNGEMMFNATDEQITKYVEEVIAWQTTGNVKGVARILLHWHRIHYFVKGLLHRLRLNINRIWGKVRSS